MQIKGTLQKSVLKGLFIYYVIIFWLFRPLPPYVINCNHLGGLPPLIKCNTVIILGDPPSENVNTVFISGGAKPDVFFSLN